MRSPAKDIINEEHTRQLIAVLNDIPHYRQMTYCEKGVDSEGEGLLFKPGYDTSQISVLKDEIKSLLGINVRTSSKHSLHTFSFLEKDLPKLAKKGLEFEGIYSDHGEMPSVPTPSSAQYCMAFSPVQVQRWISRLPDKQSKGIVIDKADIGDEDGIIRFFKEEIEDSTSPRDRINLDKVEYAKLVAGMLDEALATQRAAQKKATALAR